jgi:hypothetical protein
MRPKNQHVEPSGTVRDGSEPSPVSNRRGRRFPGRFPETVPVESGMSAQAAPRPRRMAPGGADASTPAARSCIPRRGAPGQPPPAWPDRTLTGRRAPTLEALGPELAPPPSARHRRPRPVYQPRSGMNRCRAAPPPGQGLTPVSRSAWGGAPGQVSAAEHRWAQPPGVFLERRRCGLLASPGYRPWPAWGHRAAQMGKWGPVLCHTPPLFFRKFPVARPQLAVHKQ